MKRKISKIIGGIGVIIAFTPACFDVTEFPILAIPIICGMILILISAKIDGGWFDEEEFDFDYNIDSCSDDDGITYITYDSDGSVRYDDSRRVSSLYK